MKLTVEEAIKELKSYMPKDNGYNDRDIEAFNMAIHALEENQRYHVLGTVEELQSMKDNGSFTGFEMAQLIAKLNKLKRYEVVGTEDEFKEMKSGDFSEHLLNMGYIKGYTKAFEDFKKCVEAEYAFVDIHKTDEELVELLKNALVGKEWE